MKETIVIDDVIPAIFQDKFADVIIAAPFWQFITDMSYAGKPILFPSYGFNMKFKHPEYGIVSPLYEAVAVPIINAMLEQTGNEDITDIYAARAFLQVPLEKRFVKGTNGIHVDTAQEHYACVYYVNDTDGDTIIYNETTNDIPTGSDNANVTEHKRVTPKKGRLVMFDGTRYHCSSQPRNGYRCIINFDLI